MSHIEIAATILGLASVYLTVRENIWCWPTGIAMVILYIFIFHGAKLYSDMGLQVVYVFLQIYGWYEWKTGGPKHTKLVVTRLKGSSQVVASALTIVFGSAALGFVMRTYTDAALPMIDAFAAVTSLVAQYLMARKKLECWVLWIVVDVVSIGMYIVKSLHATAALYAVFLVLATMGLIEWRKSFLNPEPA